MGEPQRTLETPDGRTLAYAVWGDPDGFPILSLHGTPGCRLGRWPHEELYADLGVCLVTHDRAGYGRSDRRRGRRVSDEADDVRVIADELGFDRFGVTGGSGGGPHSLACAALLPDRVVRATCVVGVAPLGTPGLEQDAWLAGQDPENIKEFAWALAGEDVLTRELQAEQERMEERVVADPSTVLQDFQLSESDRAELARPEVMQIMRESTLEQAVNGVGGWVDDDLAFMEPWGFDVDSSRSPCSSATGGRTCSCRRRTATGWPRTSPGASSRSTTSPATWARIPRRKIPENAPGCSRGRAGREPRPSPAR